jgi:hypothetical protein
MSVIRVGSTSTYAEGWDAIFGGTRAGRAKAGGKKKARVAAGKAVKRKAAAKPQGVKAARKARRKQSARTKR